MKHLLGELAERGMHGMKPGLGPMREVCASLGNPEKSLPCVHVAGTNGKGAVSAVLDAALKARGLFPVARYTSPHLIRINERFFAGGAMVSDEEIALASDEVFRSAASKTLTYFETLTAVAFVLFSRKRCPLGIMECGLGGRLDATNVCNGVLSVITRVGLDHCAWLGDTLEKVASEKAGIVKPGVPVVLGENDERVRAVVEERSAALGSPFIYAPDIVSEDEIPASFSLRGRFNRENAMTALAALKTLEKSGVLEIRGDAAAGFSDVVWPGRFHRVGSVIVDGAHNPPAAEALASALEEVSPSGKVVLVAGFCADKDVDIVLSMLAPFVSRAVAVRLDNPRSMSADETARKMRGAGMDAVPASSLGEALEISGALCASRSSPSRPPAVLICGSLFLAGAALRALGAYPYPLRGDADPSERLGR